MNKIDGQESQEAPPNGEKKYPYTTAKFAVYPTSPQSPPSALLAHTIQEAVFIEIFLDREGLKTIPWQAAFIAGHKIRLTARQGDKVLNKAKLKRLLY